MEDPGGGRTRDGHLELDDMGFVERDTTDLGRADHGARPELLEGPQGRTWGERLEKVGVTPFLRRHRVLAGTVTAAVALVGVAASAYLANAGSQPPPDDGVIAFKIWDTSEGTDLQYQVSSGDMLEFSYSLRPGRIGDSLRVLGLVGPGIRATTGSGALELPTYGVFHVAVIPDCDDPSVITAQPSDYRLKVERTDTLGRSVIGLHDVPLGSTVEWQQLIGLSCAQQWLDEAITTQGLRLDVRTSPTRAPVLEAGMRLHSTLPVEVTASYGYDLAYGMTPPVEGPGLVRLDPGGTALLSVDLPFSDCREAEPLGAGLPAGLTIDGLVMQTPRQSGPSVRPLVGEIMPPWPPGALRRVEASIAAACRGMPSFTLDVASAEKAAARVPSTPLEEGGMSDTTLRIRLRVRAEATRLAVADPDTGSAYRGYGYPPPAIRSTAVPMRSGVGDIDADWTTSCSPDSAPPSLRVLLTAGGRAYPARVDLHDPVLTAGFLRACGLVYSPSLRDTGWPSPA